MQATNVNLDEIVRSRHFPCSLSKADRKYIAGFRAHHITQDPSIVIIGGEDTSASYLLGKVTSGSDKYIHCYGNYTPTHNKFWRVHNLQDKIEVRNDPHSIIPLKEQHVDKRVDLLYFGIPTANIKALLNEWTQNLHITIDYNAQKHSHKLPVIIIDTLHTRGPNGVQGIAYAQEAMNSLRNNGLYGIDFSGNERIASFLVEKRN